MQVNLKDQPLDDVIENLQNQQTFYQRRTLIYDVGEEDEIWDYYLRFENSKVICVSMGSYISIYTDVILCLYIVYVPDTKLDDRYV